MNKIKKSKLIEVLSTHGINEGLIDSLIDKIARNRTDKKAKELHNKLNQTRNKLRADLVDFYGSYEAIPDSVKRVVEK